MFFEVLSGHLWLLSVGSRTDHLFFKLKIGLKCKGIEIKSMYAEIRLKKDRGQDHSVALLSLSCNVIHCCQIGRAHV